MSAELERLALKAIDAHQLSPLHPVDLDEVAREILSDSSSRRVVLSNLDELLANYLRTALGVRGAQFARPAPVVNLDPRSE